MMAMSAYRSWQSFTDRFGRQYDVAADQFAIASYLQHHGQKLVQRFDANTYITLTQAMDSHDIAQGRDYQSVLQSIKQPALVVAIDSDILYPPIEQQELADLLPHAQLGWLQSSYGHDAFLIDTAALNELVSEFRQSLSLKSFSHVTP
jgi:homoserine O-acetyltransferase